MSALTEGRLLADMGHRVPEVTVTGERPLGCLREEQPGRARSRSDTSRLKRGTSSSRPSAPRLADSSDVMTAPAGELGDLCMGGRARQH